MPPGKNDMMVRTARDPSISDRKRRLSSTRLLDYQTEKDVAFRFHYRRFVVRMRAERIPTFAKQLRINQHFEKFQRELSVFRDWQEDSPKILRECLSHDCKYWKVRRFVPSYERYEAVIEIIRSHFE